MKTALELDEGAKKFDIKFKYLTLPKIFLNVLALHYGLTTTGNWARVDDLVKKKVFSSDAGANFKKYLDITADIRLKYQFFYEQYGADEISPSKGVVPPKPEDYPKGYYVLSEADRKDLKSAQKIQADVLVPAVQLLKNKMDGLSGGDFLL